MKPVYKRKRRKQIRKEFQKRCYELWNKARDIGLSMHWTRLPGRPRSTTLFRFWDVRPSIMTIDDAEQYVEHCYRLKAFL